MEYDQVDILATYINDYYEAKEDEDDEALESATEDIMDFIYVQGYNLISALYQLKRMEKDKELGLS